jgi:flagellar hook protein FlgE
MPTDSLFTSVSGLNAYQNAIDVISNNIANVGTTGFKSQNITFQDLLYQTQAFATAPTTTKGGTDPIDEGIGVKTAAIGTDFSQGGLQTTGINTDLAINGDGFFILKNVDGSGTPTYTRDGHFEINANGVLYDPSSGLAVTGFLPNAQGVVTPSGVPTTIQIPLGLKSQAVGTGFGAKTGPSTADSVFDAVLGGNVDQTLFGQQMQVALTGSGTAPQPITISTTVYDSLGNTHLVDLTYTPDVTGATAATASPVGGTNPALISGAPSVAAQTATNDTITVNQTSATTVNITDTLGNNINANAGQTVTVGGATFTIANAPLAAGTATFTVTAAQSGLPASVTDASGNARVPATRWKVTASFTDGTTFSTIATPGSINAGGAVTAPTFGSGSSGTLGYVYFDQNGQFINSSSIESVAAGQAIGGNAAAYIHSAGNQASANQGNQLDVLKWGPGVGNNAVAPTAGGPAPATGPIALDFADMSSLAGSSTATTVSQNGYGAGILSNITVGQDGSIIGAFSNGQQQTLGQIALATFQNENGLTRIGDSQFEASANSGLAQVNAPGTGKLGSIVAGSLEESNVSLSSEFVKMIEAQSAFTANSKGVTVANQDIQTVLNLIPGG